MSDKNKSLVTLIALLSTIQLVTGWVMTGLGYKYRLFADLSHYKALITTSLTSSAVTDVLIAISLCYYLNHRRSGVKSTDTLVQKLIIYSINCGILCSLVAVLGLITFLTMPNNLINFAFNFVLGKVYSNSLLSTLNARSHLREAHKGAIALDFVETKPSYAPHQSSGVTVTTVTESSPGHQDGKYTQEYKVAEVA
ncbi:hypothetical protein MVEN_00811900 [Mycena venus]|uniref:DUF6534 domain-containing protein n=1 Tax=Mycena venus TaxID=2733690 RepID=A0A8H6YM35_9AGAR|nr:hypothetical protein MVEN_00811900 [Mycena venus]